MTPIVVWYLNRATGLVSLALMTLTVLLGVAVQRQVRLPGLPRFGVVALHRNVSLISALLLLTHIGAAVVDSYVSIGPTAVLVPFVAGWHPIAVGLGTLAVDLLLLVILTSLVRGRIPVRLWRGVHWTSYLLWPLAFLHGLNAGTDLRSGWVLGLALVCAGAVGAAAAAAWTGRRTPAAADRARAALAETRSALARGARTAVFRNR
jgi:methionine sulfoxide reductase heme-binding subunit